MYGRLDDTKAQSGASLVRNFIIQAQGSAENRTGFKYVNETKYPDKKVKLLRFSFSSEQSCLIEFGYKYFRFHVRGATLLADGDPYNAGTSYEVGETATFNGDSYYCLKKHTNKPTTDNAYWKKLDNGIYEVPHPYNEDELFDVKHVQSNDVLTLVHKNHAPMELRRWGGARWDLVKSNFNPKISAPTGISVSHRVPSSASVSSDTYQTIRYVVTAIADDEISESKKSSVGSVRTNIFVTGAYVTIKWRAVTGAKRYNIYKDLGGMFGFIGTTETTQMVDDNIAPDLSRIAKDYENEFNATGDYPGTVTYYEQRKVLGNTKNDPQTLWLTRSGTESDLSFSIPVSDSDRIKIKLASRDANEILHVIPLNDLIVFTANAEWRVTSAETVNLTPTSISIKPQSYIGASRVSPAVVNNAVVYISERGQKIRELGYDWRARGFVTNELSLRATHLFEDITIKDLTYTQSPESIIWAVTDKGVLIGVTYLPEQEVLAFHQHDTLGKFGSCCAIEEDQQDFLYVVANREINGKKFKSIERQEKRATADFRNSFYVDCGISYDGRATNGVTVKIEPNADNSLLSIVADSNIFGDNTGDAILFKFDDAEYRLTIAYSVDGKNAVAIKEVAIPARYLNVAITDWEFCRLYLSGLDHLENTEVAIFADGSVNQNLVVTDGRIKLDRASAVVHIGLPYHSDLKTLPVFTENVVASGRARVKNINHAYIRVYKSKGLLCGADEENLVEVKQRTTENYGQSTRLASAEERLMLVPSWNDNGQILIRQKDPLPLTIIDLTLEVVFGD